MVRTVLACIEILYPVILNVNLQVWNNIFHKGNIYQIFKAFID